MKAKVVRALSCLLVLCVAGAFAACGDGGNEGVLPGVQALVLVKRAFVTDDGTHDVAGGSNQTIDYLRYVPGGGVYVLEPPTASGTLRSLTGAFAGVDINGIDLSFDAKQVVFSMRHADDGNYHIYVANVDGSGDVRQLTYGDWDDIKPIFVPGDRIAFGTNQPYTAMGTRADEYNHSRVVAQIATISIAAGDADRRLCSQNLSHSADPFLLSDGTIGFSRWEHLGPVNDVKLFRMNTDCTQMVALAGQHGKDGYDINSLVQATEISPGVFVAIGTSRERTIQAGALVQIDARATGSVERIALDEQHARFDLLTPAVPTDEMTPASNVGRYRTPHALPGTDKLIVSWANGSVNDLNELAETAPNFGIYMWDPATRERTLVYDDPNAWDLYGIPVLPRDIPPVHSGVLEPAPDRSTPAILGSVDITRTSLDESVQGAQLDGMPLSAALTQATRVRIIEGFSSEIGGGIGQFGLTMHEGAAIMGEATVYADGSWEAQVPAYLPYHLQPIDRFGMSIRNQLLWVQAMPGENRRCGGCHEGRADTILPRMGPTTLAQQAGPQNFVIPIEDRTELPWINSATGGNVQDLFNAKCVSCHSGGAGDPFAGRQYMVTVTMEDGTMATYTIPYLNLSETPISVEYEDEVYTFPASYVSLLYPSAMMGDSVVTGDMPPIWVVPGASRESALIAGINANAVDSATTWAWDTATNPPHPEDVGVDLTYEERQLLIRMADLGGQYWSRKNVEGGFMYSGMEY